MSAAEVRSSKAGDLRIVNEPIRRHDAGEKVAGTTRFAADVSPHGALHARLVRSIVPHARLLNRDVSAARAIPGVVTVLLGEDVPNNEIRKSPSPDTTMSAARFIASTRHTSKPQSIAWYHTPLSGGGPCRRPWRPADRSKPPTVMLAIG